MAVDRLTPTSSTPGAVTGDDYMDAVAEEILALWKFVTVPLSIESGSSANVIYAAGAVALPGTGLADGMRFSLEMALDNTSTMTISVDGEAFVALVDSEGNALSSGSLQAGVIYDLAYVAADGHMRVMGTAQNSKVLNTQTFTASGTWTKPTSPTGAWVLVEVWGGGGGGGGTASTGAGGGGGYSWGIFAVDDLGATETVTVGAGGAKGNPGTVGGTSSFGSHLSAYGGGGGYNGGGGGGGQTSAGTAANVSTGGNGGGPVGGTGDNGTDTAATSGVSGGGGAYNQSPSGAAGFFGGGGGGAASGPNGGASFYGGGGGGGGASGTGGVSVHGGNGGATGVAGTAPGGGGGSNAAGARGEVRVRTIG